MATGTVNAQRVLEKGTEEYGIALTMFFQGVVQSFREKTRLFPISPDEDGEFPSAQAMIANSVIENKNVTEGVSHQFHMMADNPVPEYHNGGDFITGQNQEIDADTITLDKTLVASREPTLDSVEVAPFDAIPKFGRAIGESLAHSYDSLSFVTGLLAARATSLTKDGQTIHAGGNVVNRIGATGVESAYAPTATGAQLFRDDIRQINELMDQDNIPDDPMSRLMWVSPYIYNRVLTNAPNIFSDELSRRVVNDMNGGVIGMVDGITLVGRTNRLPNENVTTAGTTQIPGNLPAKYTGDFRYNGAVREPVALILVGGHEAKAIGNVIRRGISLYMDADHRRNTFFMKAEIRVGLGKLHPYCAGEIGVSAT